MALGVGLEVARVCVCVCVPASVCVCVYNPVIQGRTFFHVSMFTCLQAGGRGAHTDSSANKAGLYVVRISLGTLSDVPATGGQDLHVNRQVRGCN